MLHNFGYNVFLTHTWISSLWAQTTLVRNFMLTLCCGMTKGKYKNGLIVYQLCIFVFVWLRHSYFYRSLIVVNGLQSFIIKSVKLLKSAQTLLTACVVFTWLAVITIDIRLSETCMYTHALDWEIYEMHSIQCKSTIKINNSHIWS